MNSTVIFIVTNDSIQSMKGGMQNSKQSV